MKRNLLIVFAFLASVTHSFGQVAGTTFEMYVMQYRFGPQPLDYFQRNNIEVTNMLTLGSIAQDADENKVDATKVRNTLYKLFRDTNATGRVLLDWERAVFKDLRDYPVTDIRYQTAEAEWKKLIAIIRDYRPNLKIGIYGIPFRSWTLSAITKFNSPEGKYDNLLALTDFLAPTVYLQHPDEEVGRERNVQYIKDNMNMALSYGKRLQKPVYPFLWHRIHPVSCSEYGSELMQVDVFAYYVKLLSTYSYNNYKASGVYWWEAYGDRNELKNVDGINGWADGMITSTAAYDELMVKYATAVVEALGTVASEPAPAPAPEAPAPAPAPEESAPQQVISYTLFDATTKKEIQTLESGATLNLATLPTRSFNVRANTNTLVGSVVLSLSGAQSIAATESKAPYDLMGDFGSWTPGTGSYTLRATPYSGAKATGTAGTALTISFNVIEQASAPAPQQVVSYTLFDAGTGQEIQTLENGATLNLATLPTRSFNVRANTNTLVGSVVLSLSGAQSIAATESKAPYDLMGDFGSWTPGTGGYTLRATPYSGAKATGTAGTPLVASFTVTDMPPVIAVPDGPTFTLVNADTEQDIQSLPTGAVINLAALPTKNLNIRYNAITKVGSVAFALSGAKVKNTVESGAPYALFGDQSGNYNIWAPALGSYTLKATPYSERSAAGTAGESLSISFTVVNNTASYLGASLTSNMANTSSLQARATLALTELSVYPVPATSVLYVDLGSAVVEGPVTIDVLDTSGKVVFTKHSKPATDGRITKLDVNGLSKGVYILTVSTSEGRTAKRVVIE